MAEKMSRSTLVELLDFQNRQIGIIQLEDAIKLFRWYKIKHGNYMIERINEYNDTHCVRRMFYLITDTTSYDIVYEDSNLVRAIFKFISLVYST